MVRLLLEKGVFIDERSLRRAARNRNELMTCLLLEKGAFIYAFEDSFYQQLCLAIRNHNEAMLQLLFEKEQISMQSMSTKTPF